MQIEDSSAFEVRKAIRRNDSSVVVMFHSPTCSHCINFLPHFNSAAAKLKNIVELYTVDCSVELNQQFCYYQGCHSFPTVKMYNHQNTEDMRPINFNNQRVESALLNWISVNHRKPFEMINATDVQEKVNEKIDDKQNVLVLMSAKKPNVLIYKLANTIHNKRFLVVNLIDEEKINQIKQNVKIDVDTSKIQIFQQKQHNKWEKYTGEIDFDKIQEWLKMN